MSRAWLIVGIALLAGACGGGDEAAATATENGESPLAEFLGEDSFAFGGDSDEAEARFAEEERGRQELIATCMREQGFEYTPVNFDDASFFGDDEEGLEWGSDEWTAKYGFGISTLRFAQDSVGPNLIGHNFDFTLDASNDPNQARLEEMSESEQEAYYTALYGDTSVFQQDPTLSDEEAPADDGFFELGGCQGEAYETDKTSQFFQDFQEELDDLYRRAQSDPRLVDAQREVADCVVGKGHDFTTQQDLIDELEAELGTIDDGFNDPTLDISEEEMANLSPEELEAMFNVAPQLSDDDKSKLADIQAREIAVASAVNECDGDSDENDKLFQEVLAEYEQRFLDENQDRLTDYQAGS